MSEKDDRERDLRAAAEESADRDRLRSARLHNTGVLDLRSTDLRQSTIGAVRLELLTASTAARRAAILHDVVQIVHDFVRFDALVARGSAEYRGTHHLLATAFEHEAAMSGVQHDRLGDLTVR